MATYFPGTSGHNGDLYLDPLTGDLVLTATDVLIAKGTTAIAQSLLQRLRTFRGEWFLDTTLGVPFHEVVFAKGVNLQVVRSILRRIILETPGISSASDLVLDYDNARRMLSVTFSATTDEGQIITINNTGLP